jgi:hypothetical protein
MRNGSMIVLTGMLASLKAELGRRQWIVGRVGYSNGHDRVAGPHDLGPTAPARFFFV